MKKIVMLLSYLKASKNFEEYNYLKQVFAQSSPEEYLKNEYLDTFYKWFLEDKNSGGRLPAEAWISQINKAKSSGQLDSLIEYLENENPVSFSKVTGFFSKIKNTDRSKKISEIKSLIETNMANIKDLVFVVDGSDDTVNAAAEIFSKSSLSDEDILFILKDKTNHDIKYKVDIFTKFISKNKNLSPLERYSKDIDLMDREVSPGYSGDIESYLNKIKDSALKTSKILYDDEEFKVVLSESADATRYWESAGWWRTEDGNIISNLCTGRIDEDNQFSVYNRDSHLVDIIKKNVKSNYDGPRVSLTSGDREYNLISLSIKKDDGQINFSSGHTVNSNNNDMLKEDFPILFGKKIDKVEEAIKTGIPNFKGFPVKTTIVGNDTKSLTESNLYIYRNPEAANDIEPKSFFSRKLHEVPEQKHNAYKKFIEFGAEELFGSGLLYDKSLINSIDEKVVADKIRSFNGRANNVLHKNSSIKNSSLLASIGKKPLIASAIAELLDKGLSSDGNDAKYLAEKIIQEKLLENEMFKKIAYKTIKNCGSDTFFSNKLFLLDEAKELIAQKVIDVATNDPYSQKLQAMLSSGAIKNDNVKSAILENPEAKKAYEDISEKIGDMIAADRFGNYDFTLNDNYKESGEPELKDDFFQQSLDNKFNQGSAEKLFDRSKTMYGESMPKYPGIDPLIVIKKYNEITPDFKEVLFYVTQHTKSQQEKMFPFLYEKILEDSVLDSVKYMFYFNYLLISDDLKLQAKSAFAKKLSEEYNKDNSILKEPSVSEARIKYCDDYFFFATLSDKENLKLMTLSEIVEFAKENPEEKCAVWKDDYDGWKYIENVPEIYDKLLSEEDAENSDKTNEVLEDNFVEKDDLKESEHNEKEESVTYKEDDEVVPHKSNHEKSYNYNSEGDSVTDKEDEVASNESNHNNLEGESVTYDEDENVNDGEEASPDEDIIDEDIPL